MPNTAGRPPSGGACHRQLTPRPRRSIRDVSSLVPAESQPTPVEAPDADLDAILTHSAGPIGSLPLDADLLRDSPSGDLFGLTQNAGMGWEPRRLRSPEFLILGTQGGIRAPDG
ncbi:MAG: xylonate dehydratase, partial [Gaiellales bacterium]|nr:xylonate dehydratase [Gaiellales bacterium]